MTLLRTAAAVAVLAFSASLTAPAIAAAPRPPQKQGVKDRPKQTSPKPAAKSKQQPRPKARPKRPPRPPAKPATAMKPPTVIAGPRTDTETKIDKPGDYHFAIQHSGRTRTYRLHVPAGYTSTASAPMVVALHGAADASAQGSSTMHGMIAKSEREGFVLVLPRAFNQVPAGQRASWNAGNCCGSARDANIDDVGFIRQVVENVFGQVSIDRYRIYAAGMSDGAMMAYRLACEMPGVLRAIVTVAGTDNTQQCAPDRPVSVLHIHARDDSQVPFDGGVGPQAFDPKVALASAPTTIAKWAALNSCEVAPKRILDTAGAYCEAHSWCRGKAEVQLCVTEKGGHSWPGDKNPDRRQTHSPALDATDVMWGFFSRH